MDAGPLLTMKGVRKRFGGALALDGVDLEVRSGEVHALVGENGAGKSTLMRVLAGSVTADEGTMTLGGQALAPKGPEDALRSGVAMVYQELLLAPDLSVEDNVFLGRESRRGILRDRARDRVRLREILSHLGHAELDPQGVVARLGPGPRQVVAIARALAAEARVVVLDEPTSSLAKADVERLFDAIERLTQRGVAVIYISHFLEEIERIAHRFTVLRNGQTVHRGTVVAGIADEIIEAMAGRAIADVYPAASRAPGEPILRLDGVAGRVRPTAATLVLHRGEVFGIAGLVGTGRTELLRAVYGLDAIRRGTVTVATATDRGRHPHVRIQQKMALLSEDRRGEGLAQDRSLAENLTLSRMKPFTRFGFVVRSRRDRLVDEWIRALAIRCAGPSQLVRELSGGNQQKVALARILYTEADLLLLDEPTRGVDVGSKAEIYRVIAEAAGGGKAVLLVSSYFPELLGLCDRIAVMHRGRLGGARPAAEWTEAALLDAAARGEREAGAA